MKGKEKSTNEISSLAGYWENFLEGKVKRVRW